MPQPAQLFREWDQANKSLREGAKPILKLFTDKGCDATPLLRFIAQTNNAPAWPFNDNLRDAAVASLRNLQLRTKSRAVPDFQSVVFLAAHRHAMMTNLGAKSPTAEMRTSTHDYQLSRRELLVDLIIRSNGPIMGKEIVEHLEKQNVIMVESTLRTQIIPSLKRHCGLKTRARVGYFYSNT